MKVTSVDDEVDDTDIDGTEVFTGVQVAKQVRNSMKKWIKKQDDVFWHNYVKMNIIHCVLNMKEVQGHFSINKVYGMWKSYDIAAKKPMLFQIGIDMHTKLCYTKIRSAERLTQLAIHKCLPRSSHRSAMNTLLYTSIGVHYSLSQDTKMLLATLLKTNNKLKMLGSKFETTN